MTKNSSASKRVQIGSRNNLRNRRYKSSIKTAVKKITAEIELASRIESSDHSKANLLLSHAYSKIDKAVKKGVMHQNKAARKKSVLVNSLRIS